MYKDFLGVFLFKLVQRQCLLNLLHTACEVPVSIDETNVVIHPRDFGRPARRQFLAVGLSPRFVQRGSNFHYFGFQNIYREKDLLNFPAQSSSVGVRSSSKLIP